MKTRENLKDEHTAVEGKQATDGHRWTQMESAGGEDRQSVDRAQPRNPFRIRASEGSSVFNLLFPR
jgi:hypothetical protein